MASVPQFTYLHYLTKKKEKDETEIAECQPGLFKISKFRKRQCHMSFAFNITIYSRIIR